MHAKVERLASLSETSCLVRRDDGFSAAGLRCRLTAWLRVSHLSVKLTRSCGMGGLLVIGWLRWKAQVEHFELRCS